MLVQVYASTVTRADAIGARSEDYRFSCVHGDTASQADEPGHGDFAGRVEQVGPAVSEFRAGSRSSASANAEYVTVREDRAS